MKIIITCCLLFSSFFLFSQTTPNYSGYWKTKWKTPYSGYDSVVVAISNNGNFYDVSLKQGSSQEEWRWTANLSKDVLETRTKTEGGDSPIVSLISGNKIEVSNFYLMGRVETELNKWNRNDVTIDVYVAWSQFINAYSKKDTITLIRLLQLPIRENAMDMKYGINPSFNLKQFLLEASYLKKYNLSKSSPFLNQELKGYASFEGYEFKPEDQVYEVKLKRNRTTEELKKDINTPAKFEMTLYFKANNGIFKLFAFAPEVGFNDVDH